jgi:carbon monoxide dehydrogenase subunit G
VLLDIERIGPCMPGAVVDSVTGDDFTGRVKVKLGPINLTYQGKASFIEKDEANRRAVIDARGKDQRGNGTAAAIVTATLAEEGSITRVDVLTDLNITGRPAQFGRGVMTDVGNKLLGQFAEKLAAQLGEGDAQGDAARAEAASAPTSAAATATGVVEEVAASAEQVPGEGAAAKATRATGAAAKKAAASATDAVTGGSSGTPAKKAPAKKAAAAASSDTVAIDTGSAGTARGAKAPSTPPSGTTAPPTKPATGAPVRSVPSAPPRAVAQGEPEPIDLLEVAGGAAMARFAAPAAGVGAVVLLILLLLRRRRR